MTSMAPFWCVHCCYWPYISPFSIVSIVDLEQLSVCLIGTIANLFCCEFWFKGICRTGFEGGLWYLYTPFCSSKLYLKRNMYLGLSQIFWRTLFYRRRTLFYCKRTLFYRRRTLFYRISKADASTVKTLRSGELRWRC